MRTKTSDFLNTDTMKPEYSFQFSDGGVWRYPLANGTKEPMRLATTDDRDAARFQFRRRKTAAAAYDCLSGSPVMGRLIKGRA